MLLMDFLSMVAMLEVLIAEITSKIMKQHPTNITRYQIRKDVHQNKQEGRQIKLDVQKTSCLRSK